MKRYGKGKKLELRRVSVATLSPVVGGNNTDPGGSGPTAECPSQWTCFSCDWQFDDHGNWICR